MSILHYSPGLRPGSISQLAADLAAGLQDAGFSNIVVSPSNELVGPLTAAGVRHCSAQEVSIFSLWREVKRLRRHIIREQASVVLAYGPAAARTALLACRKFPIAERPKLVTVLTGFPRGVLRTRALRHCDVLVSISKFLRSEVTKRFALPSSCSIWSIPYGIHEVHCHPQYHPTPEWEENWARNYARPDSELTICVPCPLSPIHGLELLPSIITGLRAQGITPHVYIAGDTATADRRWLSSLRHQFEQEGVESAITWLGLRNDLRDILSSCDLTLSLALAPASHDRAVLEALALGRLVIAFDHGAVGEMLDTFLPEGRVRPGDAAGIIDTITQWVTLRPDTLTAVPYPYRFQDTVRSFSELCTALNARTEAKA